jgi:hypothetical protein
MDRQKAAAIMVGIPERQLLAAMHGIDSVVDVQRHGRGWTGKAGAELVHQRRGQARRLDLSRHVLQPAHGRLRAQRVATARAPADGELQQRIMPQTVEIVRILVAASDGEDAVLRSSGSV